MSLEAVSGTSQVTQVLNPTFAQWHQLDQSLLGWLLSSISKEVHAQVTNLTTSQKLWNSLEKLFGNQSRAKLMQLKLELQSIKKNSLSINAYFSKIKQLSDNLAMAGQPVSDVDFVMYLLAGLRLEYDAIVGNINSSRDLLDIEEILALLLGQEIRLQQAAISLKMGKLDERVIF